MSAHFLLTNESYRLTLSYNHQSPAPITGILSARNDSAAFQMLIHNEEHPYSVSLDPSDWNAYNELKANVLDQLKA